MTEFWKDLLAFHWDINIHGPVVIIHCKPSIVDLMVISPYLGFLTDWISMSDCSYGDILVIGQINIWFPVERLTDPPPLSFLLSLSGIRVREWEVGTVNIKWLIGAVTVDRSGPWLPDVLVHWCQQQDLSLGFARVCRGGQTVRRRLPSGVLSLTRACHSCCLFLYPSLSVDCWCWCPMTIPILWQHFSCHMFQLK